MSTSEHDSAERPVGPLDGASPSLAAALATRFVLELALLVGAAVLVWNLASGWWRWPAAILAVVIVAVIWGLFLSPRARVRLPRLAAFLLEAALFIGVGAGLFAIGYGTAAVISVAVWIGDRGALKIFAKR